MNNNSIPNLQLLTKLSEMFNPVLGEGASNRALKNLKDEFIFFAVKFIGYINKETEGYPDHIKLVSQAANQMINEWHSINSACEQRQLINTDGLNIVEKINTATLHAKRYFDQFQGYKFLGDEPIVYFDKAYGITRYAFTPYALIGLPVQSLLNEHWEALAHELGHHVYWNSFPLEYLQPLHNLLEMRLLQALSVNKAVQGDENALFQRFYHPSQLAVLWITWLEETFADVFGTLMGGIAYVLSSIDLCEELIGDGLGRKLDEKDEHPSAFIRPFIAIETLQWSVDSNRTETATVTQNHMQDLRMRWEAILADTLIKPKEKSRLDLRTDSGLGEQQIRRSIPTVVKTILGTNWYTSEKPDGPTLDILFTNQATGVPPAEIRAMSTDELQNRVNSRFDELNAYFESTLHQQGLIDNQSSPEETKRRKLEILTTFNIASPSGICKKCIRNSNGCCQGCS